MTKAIPAPPGQQGYPGPQGIQGPQGPVFGNDGTADLNIHSFKSDGGNIYSNGSGGLTTQGLSTFFKIIANGSINGNAILLHRCLSKLNPLIKIDMAHLEG